MFEAVTGSTVGNEKMMTIKHVQVMQIQFAALPTIPGPM